jgi:hypothetical protein
LISGWGRGWGGGGEGREGKVKKKGIRAVEKCDGVKVSKKR